jgi:hypothetical protein
LVNPITKNIKELFVLGGWSMQFNEKELAFLRIICSSEHRHISQDFIFNKLIEDEIIKPEEFKTIKRKLLYSGVIGVVYGNITLEKKEILDIFNENSSTSME